MSTYTYKDGTEEGPAEGPVSTYSYKDGTEEGPAEGPTSTYSYKDGTDEGPAEDPVWPAVRFLAQHVLHVLKEAHHTCTAIIIYRHMNIVILLTLSQPKH